MKIAILASTKGTTLQAIIDQIKAGALSVELMLVVSHKECGAIEKAKKQGFKTLVIPKQKSPADFDRVLVAGLRKQQVDLVILAGYMSFLGPTVIQAFPKKIINIHPSLIPKYCGKNFYGDKVHAAVLANQEAETGITIHFVDEGLDTGEIICRKTVPIEVNETVDSLKVKVQALEKKWYPEIIKQLAIQNVVDTIITPKPCK